MFNPRRNKKGFTIIELIVVIAIIAILAAIAIPSFIGITDQANQKVAIANANSIATAVNTWNALHPVAADQVASVAVGDFATLEGKLSGADYDLWPKGMTSDQFDAACAYISYSGGVATVDQTALTPPSGT
jgi:type IV pilus assembly protein PilA